MAKRSLPFSVIPQVPFEGVTPMQHQLLTSLRENVELLTGTRGDAGTANRAVTSGQVRVNPAPRLTTPQVSATGSGVSISDATVPTLDDYANLIADVQGVMNDVAALRETVNALIQQLRA